MGMNSKNRMRNRNHFNNNRRFNNNIPNKNTVYESQGPVGKMRGTAFQLMDKYTQAAKDYRSSDRVLCEICLQYAEHYMRINALATAAEQRMREEREMENENVEIISGGNEEISENDENVEEVEVETDTEAEDVPSEVMEEETVCANDENEEDSPVEIVSELDLSVPVEEMNKKEPKRKTLTLKKNPEENGEKMKRRGRRPAKDKQE